MKPSRISRMKTLSVSSTRVYKTLTLSTSHLHLPQCLSSRAEQLWKSQESPQSKRLSCSTSTLISQDGTCVSWTRMCTESQERSMKMTSDVRSHLRCLLLMRRLQTRKTVRQLCSKIKSCTWKIRKSNKNAYRHSTFWSSSLRMRGPNLTLPLKPRKPSRSTSRSPRTRSSLTRTRSED